MSILLLTFTLAPDGPPPPLDRVSPADVVAMIAAMLAILAALRWRNRLVLTVAGFVAGTVVCGVMLAGPLVFPLLFFAWRRNPGKGLGWLLLATMACGTALLAWRMPWPAPASAGPLQSGQAVVVGVRTKTELWSSWHTPGQSLRKPFRIATLEFTPAGFSAPVQVADSVDEGSVPALRQGATVAIEYPASNPRGARITGATRNYARDALVWFLELTYGLAAGVVLVGLQLGRARRRVLGSTALRRFAVGQAAYRRIATLPDDEARRRAFEELLGRPLRARRKPPPGQGN